MKDIKVIFKGNKHPSGYATDKEFWIGSKYLDNLQKTGKYDIEVLEKPKPKPKAKPKAKKKADKKEAK